MANLKDLKNRITSVKGTQKITKAMQMVAASKLRRTQQAAEAARPYSHKMARMLSDLATGTASDNLPELLRGRGDESRVHLLVVVTADRGLCGGFNSSIAKSAVKRIDELVAAGRTVKVLTVGKKGREALRHARGDYLFDHFDTSHVNSLSFKEAKAISKLIIDWFKDGEIDTCTMVFNTFVNALTQNVTNQRLIPFNVEEAAEEAAPSEAVYDYEPSEEEVLEDLVPRNIAVQIYHALLESQAGEHGARMTAMDSATRNAGEMIKKLTLEYNRSRQAAITTELTEIIAGAESV